MGNKTKYTFHIELPPGFLYLTLALHIVYDLKVALLTLGAFTVFFTILKAMGIWK